MIIALTGEKLAGKGTVADYLARQHQAKVLRFSQPLVDILARLHQPNTRAELVALGSWLRSRFGDDILAQVIAHDAKQLTGLVVIDGMRYNAEYQIFKTLDPFFLLNITAPLTMRYERTKQRTEKLDEQTMSLAEFTQREQDATELQIKAVQAAADYTIHNTGSMAELYKHVDQWCTTLPLV